MKRKKINEFVIEFPSKSENECFARQVVSSFAAQLDPTFEELADLRTVVSEAVTNCIVHAYRGISGIIYISVKNYDDGTVCIKIRDHGCGIEDIDQCRRPLYTTDPTGERGGMGFAIMESFSDSMKVKSKVGQGTTVTLMKKLAK